MLTCKMLHKVAPYSVPESSLPKSAVHFILVVQAERNCKKLMVDLLGVALFASEVCVR